MTSTTSSHIVMLDVARGQILRTTTSVAWRRDGKVSDLRSTGRWFDSRSGHYLVATTWMGDCLRTGKTSWYITNTKVNSAFHPSWVGKSSIDLSGRG